MRQGRKRQEKTMQGIFTLCGFIAVVFVVLICGFLLYFGTPAITKIGLLDFLTGTKWAAGAKNPSFGILPFILTSLYGTLGAMLIGVPIGVLCAAWIARVATNRIGRMIRTAVELLAGIPSVVYGLVGMLVLVPVVRDIFGLPDGANLFSAILVLAVMILPTVISVSETAIRAVPKEYEEGSLALGATKTETLFRVILPAARSGIVTAAVLGVGRSIGEAMAVMMVSGNVSNMPGIFKSVRFLTTAVASEMSYASGLHRQALFSVALVLFAFIILINLILGIIKRKG